MIDPAINLLVTLAFVVLFGNAAATKLRALPIFTATLADYRLIPRAFLRVAGVLVIAIEGVVAAGLIWPDARGACGVIGAGVLLVYGAAIAINLIRGRPEIDCGCSLQRRPIAYWMVVRNLLFALALLVLALPIAPRPLVAGDVATIGGALLVTTLLYGSLDLLLSPEHS